METFAAKFRILSIVSYHPRIETPDLASLGTIRTRNSELWLINNQNLELAILGYVAKFTIRYKVKLYALAIEGNHLHTLAHYPQPNRSHFKRDLNSCVARAIPRYVSSYPGGRIWARRYSVEYVPSPEDIENWFFYTVLQPIQDGLVDRISDYPGYNCFNDAVAGIERKYRVINWGAYHERRRWDRSVRLRDFIEEHGLCFTRLPGYEKLSHKEYRKVMLEKLESRRQKILSKRRTPSPGPECLKKKVAGSRPYRTKVSVRETHRPRILSVSRERRVEFETWYFDIYFRYREASSRYRAGDSSAEFPPGTYKPPLFTCAAHGV